MDNIVEKEIDGIKYRARFRGMAFAIDLIEIMRYDNSQFRLAERLFNEVLVSPKVTIDDFADINSFLRVQSFLLSVAQGNAGKRISKAHLKRRVEENWALWRLVMSERFDYAEVFGKPYMTPQDVEEANIALDKQIDAEKKAMKKK